MTIPKPPVHPAFVVLYIGTFAMLTIALCTKWMFPELRHIESVIILVVGAITLLLIGWTSLGYDDNLHIQIDEPFGVDFQRSSRLMRS